MAEQNRLQEDERDEKKWKQWGPYLSERQWATVREDYSPDGDCWNYFPHDMARSRAYRWGEDGLLGITDQQSRLCLGLALWNGKDPMLKERLFGLTNPEGNHGEDVKELYYYLDSTPTHSYMKALYKYPQSEFPYTQLVEENRKRTTTEPEFEIQDTGVFNDGKYWDVFAEYCKNAPDDVLCRYTLCNRSKETCSIIVLPTLWFYNTWVWGCSHESCTREGCSHEGCTTKPTLRLRSDCGVDCSHETLGPMTFLFDCLDDGTAPKLVFTENETNTMRLFELENSTPYVKDAFHDYIVDDDTSKVSPDSQGTKMAGVYRLVVPAGGSVQIRCRLLPTSSEQVKSPFGQEFNDIFTLRLQEADDFYDKVIGRKDAEHYRVSRQALAGLLWSKQFYQYIVKDWLDGDRSILQPPEERKTGRNCEFKHLFNRDVISMPDKWEYPWYASWDLAFHMITMARVDVHFAKEQLLLFLGERYMHPNGQIPAFEFSLSDVTPPVHAWSCLAVWRMSGPRGARDMHFLASCFQKLVINFTWWVNRKDPDGNNIFTGGFLGLDNIGVFDRGIKLPEGCELEQADGTAWMAFYCVCMLEMAIKLANHDPVYEEMATKFFEHFVTICEAINSMYGEGLWDEKDSFYYDRLIVDGNPELLRVRSLVGLVPLFATLVLEEDAISPLKGFSERVEWFLNNREDLARRHSYMLPGKKRRQLLNLPTESHMRKVLACLLSEDEFLSPFGIRSLSKYHEEHPFEIHTKVGGLASVNYQPGESTMSMFGGNSNWRGPIWLCMNYLIIESLRRYDYFYGESLKVDFPTGSGNSLRLRDVAVELSKRLVNLFVPDSNGRRPCHGNDALYKDDPHFKDLVLFYEYFHADEGRGCGASHQTGWTALVVNCIDLLPQ